MGQAIRIIKKRVIEYSPMMKITYNELNEIIGHVGKIMYAIHKIPFVWVNFLYRDWETDRKSTRLNSSHITRSRMPSSA